MEINRMMQLQNQSNGDLDPTGIDEQHRTIGVPFHLSVSQNYRQQTGFTNSIPSESISYDQITSLAQFAEVVKYDVAGSEFKNNYRGKQNFLRSDVLIFDVDNDGQDHNYWDNQDHWLTIAKFEQIFADYEWLIETSFSHQKEKMADQLETDFMSLCPLVVLLIVLKNTRNYCEESSFMWLEIMINYQLILLSVVIA